MDNTADDHSFGSTMSRRFSRSASSRTLVESKVEEVKKRTYTRTQWIALATLVFSDFCVGACFSLQAPFFPHEAEKKGATPTEYGLIFGSFELTVFLTSPFVGKLVGRVQPKFIMNASLLIVGTTSICFGLLDFVDERNLFVGLAFGVRILEAVAAGGAQIAGNVIVAALFPDKIATTFSLLETFLGIGLIVGPTLGGALFDVGGFGLPFYVMGALMIFNALIIFMALPEPEQTESKKEGNWLKFWLHPVTLVYVLVVFSSFNFIGYCSATLEPHLRQFDLAKVYVGLIFSLDGGLYALSAPFWGWLCDKKFDEKVICIFGCMLSVVALLLIGPMPFLHLGSNLGIICCALAIMGVSLGAKLVCAFSGSLKDTIARGFPSDFSTTGLVSSMFISAQSLGAFIGPSVGGYLLETVGYDFGTLVVLSFEGLVLIFLIAYAIISRIRPKKRKDTQESEKEPLLRNCRAPSYSGTSSVREECANSECKIITTEAELAKENMSSTETVQPCKYPTGD